MVATGLGATGLDDYVPPRERVAEWLSAPPQRASRAALIADMAAATGGEVTWR